MIQFRDGRVDSKRPGHADRASGEHHLPRHRPARPDKAGEKWQRMFFRLNQASS